LGVDDKTGLAPRIIFSHASIAEPPGAGDRIGGALSSGTAVLASCDG
jgi:hypothetical protein